MVLAAVGLAACGDAGEDVTTTETVAAPVSSTATAPAASEEDGSSAASTGNAATEPAVTADSSEPAPSTESTQASEAVTTISGGDLGENPLRLTAADLPGFTEVPFASNAPDCFGPALDAGAAIAIAPNAFRPADEQSEARSRTWSYVDEAAAGAAFATASGPDVAACTVEGAEKGLQSDDYEPGGGVTRGELSLPQLEGADEQGGASYVVTFTPKGAAEAITGYADVVVVRQGTTVAAYQFIGNGSAFPPAQEQAALTAALARGAGTSGR